MSKQKHLDIGITVAKSKDVSEWYTQVITKGELIDYTLVSGCYILRPNAYAIWEKLQFFIDGEIKKRGVKNVSFPLFIPESLLKKEASHIQGFKAEVAWVTQGGDHDLVERLAIRPTSETIICDAFSRWVRSYRDLPIKINQWCNVVRWEFKHPTPFLRTREFLWQEGHTVHANDLDAKAEVLDMLGVYKHVFEEVLAIPMISGRKSDAEKFAGAEYTLSVETFLPSGKAIQGATSHYLGHHFAKVFDIGFLDENGVRQLVHHNSWGFSTRAIGVMVLMHSDDKGLVLPPKVAPLPVVIVPIIFDKTKVEVLAYASRIQAAINVESHIDTREEHTAGYKFNYWELVGVPLRVECGPKDVEKNQVVVVRRDTGHKEVVSIDSVSSVVDKVLDDIQKSLFEKAKKMLDASIIDVSSFDELKKVVNGKRVARVSWCGNSVCEKRVIDACEASKSLCIPLEQPKKLHSCAVCGEKGVSMILFARSY